jgi:hypothetical protein
LGKHFSSKEKCGLIKTKDKFTYGFMTSAVQEKIKVHKSKGKTLFVVDV